MKAFLLITCICFIATLPLMAFAQPVYQPVVQIPGLDPNTQGTDQYVNALYLLAITIAALLAVVKIIFGGVKWMLSDVVTDKASAKKDMWGAVLGLLIVLSTVLILNTINPNLTKLNFLENATPLNVTLSNNSPDAQTPDHLLPDDDENLTLIPCETNNSVTSCESAVAKCQNMNGSSNVSHANNGKLYCYTPKSGGSCDGYRNPTTGECYGSTIDLGSSFENQPGNVREAECYRLGGKDFDYKTGECYTTKR